MPVISLVVAPLLYGIGLWRLWRVAGTGSGVSTPQAVAFGAGWLALVLALSPLMAAWSEASLAVHMVQHELLMVVAAPLIAMSGSAIAMLWALPANTRRSLAASAPRWRATWRALTAPLTVFLLHAAVLWVWHLPRFYEAALASPALHAAEHLSFFGTAALFWWGLAHGRYGRAGYGPAALYVFATTAHSGLLGALFTVSPRVIYAWYHGHPGGFTALEDQQLAGLIMWVPAGTILVGAGLAFFAAWLREAERRARLAAPPLTEPASKPAAPVVMLCIALLLSVGVMACQRGSDAKSGGPGPYAPQGRPAGAPPQLDIVSELAGAEWRMPTGDYGNLRYSTLNTITTANAMHLRPITTFSTGVARGHEGQPLVIGSTMYVVTPFPNNLIAVDLTKPGGAVKWIYEPHPDPRAVGIACCDVVNRGAAYGDGKIVYSLLDATVVAVDAETGMERWRTRVGDINKGETFTGAPLVIKSTVIVGNSGAELGVRGYVAALELGSGAERWRAYNTGPDADVKIGPAFRAFYAKDRGTDLGAHSWPREQWKLGGATAWGWMSYDPATNLFFYGTANPGVWNPDLRPGDNKWSSTIFARDADTGEARWAYQVSPHDQWDYDEIMENVLLDMDYGGRRRKLLVHPGRTGFVYVLDRQTGELLSAEAFQPVNWAFGYDLASGKPRENVDKHTHFGTVTQGICPSSTGGKEVVPSAFSPRTGLLYIPAHNTCMDYAGIEANYIAGTPYLGADVKMYQGPGGYHGELVAWDVANNRKAWGVKDLKFPLYSGVLATAGDVVFYGTMDGWLKAVDARTGNQLWQFHCASGIVGNPITYLGPDGKQYIAVYSGIGGWMGAVAFPDISADDPYAALGVVGAMKDIKKYTAAGSTVYVFGL
jgi:lanthanide-dependent methanol dehydrogenase